MVWFISDFRFWIVDILFIINIWEVIYCPIYNKFLKDQQVNQE